MADAAKINSMKARKDDLIVCNCPAPAPPAGKFREDVEDEASVTTDAILIDSSSTDIHDNSYFCRKCHATVAQQLREGEWNVRTRSGWLK
jgi:hypothetical protein